MCPKRQLLPFGVQLCPAGRAVRPMKRGRRRRAGGSGGGGGSARRRLTGLRVCRGGRVYRWCGLCGRRQGCRRVRSRRRLRRRRVATGGGGRALTVAQGGRVVRARVNTGLIRVWCVWCVRVRQAHSKRLEERRHVTQDSPLAHPLGPDRRAFRELTEVPHDHERVKHAGASLVARVVLVVPRTAHVEVQPAEVLCRGCERRHAEGQRRRQSPSRPVLRSWGLGGSSSRGFAQWTCKRTGHVAGVVLTSPALASRLWDR